MASAQIFLAQGLHTLNKSAALVAGGEVLPAPLAHDHNPKQLQQAGNDRQQVDGVEDSLDEDLDNNHCSKDADDLADASHLVPVDLVKGLVHLAQYFAVALRERSRVIGRTTGGVHRWVRVGLRDLYFGGGVAHGTD